MSINPTLAMWLKIALTIMNLVVNGTITLTGLVSAQTATLIIALCQIAITAIGAVMSAYSSTAPGPLAPADPPVVKAATALAALPADAMPSQVAQAKQNAKAAIMEHQP